LGEVVARFYSEPLNRIIRDRLGNRPNTAGLLVGADTNTRRKADPAD